MNNAPDNPSGPDSAASRLELRLADLEMRVAFQDDLLNTLNDQLAGQQQTLQRLWDLNRILREQMNSLREPQFPEAGEEAPPPHY